LAALLNARFGGGPITAQRCKLLTPPGYVCNIDGWQKTQRFPAIAHGPRWGSVAEIKIGIITTDTPNEILVSASDGTRLITS